MAKTNAERQKEWRARRKRWPTSDYEMERLLWAAYWLGRNEQATDPKHHKLGQWDDIQQRILDEYMGRALERELFVNAVDCEMRQKGYR